MKIGRRFNIANQNIYSTVEYGKRASCISNLLRIDGSLKFKTFAIVAGCSIAMAGCRSSGQNTRQRKPGEPYSYVDIRNNVAMTNVNLNVVPPGIPTNAELTFFGRRGNTYPVRHDRINEPGTLYIYDDTEKKVLGTFPIDPNDPGIKVKFDNDDELRGYFLSGRVKPIYSAGAATTRQTKQ
jgi:hypothetical protein